MVKCQVPGVIKEDATYQEIVIELYDTRYYLRSCGLKHNKLVDLIEKRIIGAKTNESK